MISKTKPKDLAKAKIVELKKGLPLQYLNGKYLIDLKEKRWQSMFIVTMFRAINKKFDVLNDFELNKVFDYILMSTSTQDEVVKELNKHIGKYVIFYEGSGKKLYLPQEITRPGVTDKRLHVKRKGIKDSANTLESNLKKLAK